MGDSGNLKHPIYLINQTTATPISPLLKNVLLFNRRGDHDFISDPINVGMEEPRTEVHFSKKKINFPWEKFALPTLLVLQNLQGCQVPETAPSERRLLSVGKGAKTV